MSPIADSIFRANSESCSSGRWQELSSFLYASIRKLIWISLFLFKRSVFRRSRAEKYHTAIAAIAPMMAEMISVISYCPFELGVVPGHRETCCAMGSPARTLRARRDALLDFRFAKRLMRRFDRPGT